MCDESGGASVFACLALTGLVAMTGTLLHLGGGVAARHRAQSAADLGALAAAYALADGSESPCTAAESIGQRMIVEVSDCRIEGWDVVVTTATRVGPASVPLGTARAVARAGPAT